MSMAGLDIFDITIQKTQVWLNDLMDELGWETRDRHKAYLVLRTVLHTLRDRLTVEEAAQLGAQLPMLVRGFYYEGWTPHKMPIRERHKEEFLGHVKQAFQRDENVDPETLLRAALRVLERHVSAGEIDDVQHLLPKHVRELWPETGQKGIWS